MKSPLPCPTKQGTVGGGGARGGWKRATMLKEGFRNRTNLVAYSLLFPTHRIGSYAPQASFD